jgi:hypothetical protein
MAASNPTAITLMPISEKLARGNFVVWKAQVIAILRGAQLTEFLDGSNPAPEEKLMIKVQKEKKLRKLKKYRTLRMHHGKHRSNKS